MAAEQLLDTLQGLLFVPAGRIVLGDASCSDEVMRNSGQLFSGGLGRADTHLAVDLPGVGGDDFAPERLRKTDSDVGFSRGGGT